MSDKKKATNKKKNGNKDKVLRGLNISFAVIAVVSLIITILLSPLGDKLVKKDTTAESTTEKETILVVDEQETLHGLPYADGNYYWPEPTEPTVDPLLNYTLFINVIKFHFTQDAGITTVTSKDDSSAIMTITPRSGVDYNSLCETVSSEHGNPEKDKNLPNVEISCRYSSKADNMETVVYCVDDMMGGSIEIQYTYPTNYENAYDTQFELMLSMFELA
jgi:hypothetical protein